MPQPLPTEVDDLGPYPPAGCPAMSMRPEGWFETVIITDRRSIIGDAVRNAAASAPGACGHRWTGNWPTWQLRLWFAPGTGKALVTTALMARLQGSEAPEVDPSFPEQWQNESI